MSDEEDVPRRSEQPTPPAAVGAAWHFEWVDAAAPHQLAQVSGQLRWRGFDLAFALDGLSGIDGRLSAGSLATVSPHLQQLVLHHVADECVRALSATALADLAVVTIEWHEDPLPMEGEFAFSLLRPGVRRRTNGCLTAFDEAGQTLALNALTDMGWSLPITMRQVAGQLHIGSLRLTAGDVIGLALGDLVWIDDAELAPAGLRAQFIANDGNGRCSAWIKRGSMQRDAVPVASLVDDGARPTRPAPSANARLQTLQVRTTSLSVARDWLRGKAPLQRLPAPALAMAWQACLGPYALFDGELVVVGRRLGLRVTRTLAHAEYTNDE